MTLSLPGIHHVTAITADAQKNIDFYTGALGLRLVKLTVNFDDPASYHLYYGDELGRPGTALTFFAWNGATPGRVGPPQAVAIAFAVPMDSMPFWSERLAKHGVERIAQTTRFGQPVIQFIDPDAMQLEIVGVAEFEAQPWAKGPVPSAHAIGGFHSVALCERSPEKTIQTLTGLMNFTAAGDEGNRLRFRASGDNALASLVDVISATDLRHGTLGAGIIHHVAFRTPDDAGQAAWREKIAAAGLDVSPIMDRCYFHSIYYREPGGVLFEIATDGPGFTTDEPAEKLGTKLMLPPWLEPHRDKIEETVPPVRLPKI